MAAKLTCGLLALLLLVSSGLAQETDAEKAATRDYVVAQGFQKKRLYANAVTHWKTFLTAHPKSVRVPAVRLNLAVCQLQLKKYPESVATLKQLLTYNEEAPSTSLVFSPLYLPFSPTRRRPRSASDGSCLSTVVLPGRKGLAFRPPARSGACAA